MLPEASRVGTGRFCTFFFIIILGERDGILRNRLGFFNSDRLYGDCLSSSSAY